MTRIFFFSAALLFVILLAGCSQDVSTESLKAAISEASIDGSQFLLNEEPSGAEDVIAVRSNAKNNDPVVVVGRIGGSKNPWVEGRAAFSIVDLSLLPCSDREGDNCPIPWDYCCETDKLPTSKALVKFIAEDGQLLAVGACELFDIEPLQTVVIRGQVRRDEAGNLTVLADGIFIRK